MKKIILKTFFLLTVFVWVFNMVGCSKDANVIMGADYFIKFKVDGKQIEYKPDDSQYNLVGNFNKVLSSGSYGSSIVGQKDDLENGKNAIIFLISDKSSLQVNVTYVNASGGSNKMEPELFSIIYQNEKGVPFSTINNEALIPKEGVLDAEMVYTEVTDGYIKGKFSGTFYDKKENAIKISEGLFYVKNTP